MTALKIKFVYDKVVDQPTRVAVFSSEDILQGQVGIHSLGEKPVVVEIDGEPMQMRVSQFVPKGMVFFLDTGSLGKYDSMESLA